MNDAIPPGEPLFLLARLYRERRSGVLTLGPEPSPLRVWLRDGHIAGLSPLAPPPGDAPPLPGPDDSAQVRLSRLLRDIGIRTPKATRGPSRAAARELRERLLDALAGDVSPAAFEDGPATPAGVVEAGGATEPTLLEAVRRLSAERVRTALGDLGQRLVATTALAEERTLTLTEGYLLSRIDGTSSVREVLQLVPLDPAETERTLLGLLLTGRVEHRPAPVARAVPPPPPAAPAEEPPPVEPFEGPSPADGAREPPAADATPPPSEEAAAPEPAGAPEAAVPPEAELDPETLERRREILGVFQSLPLKNHFEVLGVEPGCTDAEVKRAYVALAKRYHPDAHFDPRLDELRDVLEAIFIRVGEAWEVLGAARSRAAYEARLGVVRRPVEAGARPASPEGVPAARPSAAPPPPAAEPVPAAEETLSKAQVLLAQARYWDAIQMLEAAVPQMESRRAQHRGRILLARAFAKNPNWVRRAEETLHDVVREDPANADAHYELGLIYKAGGLPARAQAMFRRVVELRPDHREAAAELDAPEAAGGGLLKRLFGKGRTG